MKMGRPIGNDPDYSLAEPNMFLITQIKKKRVCQIIKCYVCIL